MQNSPKKRVGAQTIWLCFSIISRRSIINNTNTKSITICCKCHCDEWIGTLAHLFKCTFVDVAVPVSTGSLLAYFLMLICLCSRHCFSTLFHSHRTLEGAVSQWML